MNIRTSGSRINEMKIPTSNVTKNSRPKYNRAHTTPNVNNTLPVLRTLTIGNVEGS